MGDVVTVIRKEWWELRHSARRLYWLIGFIALPALLLWGDSSRSLVPFDFLWAILPMMFAMSVSGQIVLDSVLGEKKAKTLEVLLSTNIPTLAIVVGKVIPAVGAGFVLSQILLIGFTALFPIYATLANSSTAWLLFAGPLLVSYVASCLTIATTILVQDEKLAPAVSLMIVLAPIVLLGRVSDLRFSTESIMLIIAAVVLFCGFITWLASWALKKIPLIIEI